MADGNMAERQQKAYYPEDDLAEWIEKTAEESERSESFVVVKILEGVREAAKGEAINVNLHDFKCELNRDDPEE